MRLRDYLSRLSLFSVGCATQTAYQTQSQPSPKSVAVPPAVPQSCAVPRAEALVISIIILAIVCFIFIAFKNSEKTKKKPVKRKK